MTDPSLIQEWAEWLLLLQPEWTVEPGHYGAIVICRPMIGAVTVDFKMRNFAMGCVPVREKGAFKGLGWQKKLMATAVEQLSAIQ